jgi:hypothetical protein
VVFLVLLKEVLGALVLTFAPSYLTRAIPSIMVCRKFFVVKITLHHETLHANYKEKCWCLFFMKMKSYKKKENSFSLVTECQVSWTFYINQKYLP